MALLNGNLRGHRTTRCFECLHVRPLCRPQLLLTRPPRIFLRQSRFVQAPVILRLHCQESLGDIPNLRMHNLTDVVALDMWHVHHEGVKVGKEPSREFRHFELLLLLEFMSSRE